MRRSIGLAIGLLAGWLIAGCATPPQKFPFREVSVGIYEGSVPKKERDFEMLRDHGIRTIQSLRTLPWHISAESRKAEENGIGFVNTPVPASPFEPSEESIKAALLALHDPALRPIYIHCFLGRDRTTL